MSKLPLHRCETGTENELVQKAFSLIELAEPIDLLKPILIHCKPNILFIENISWENIEYNIEAGTKNLENNRRIDITIETDDTIIGIEAKLESGFGDKQIEDYAKELSFSKKNKVLILLTKYPVKESDKIIDGLDKKIEIVELTWTQISEVIQKLIPQHTGTLNNILITLEELLYEFNLNNVNYTLKQNNEFDRLKKVFLEFNKKKELFPQRGSDQRTYNNIRSGNLFKDISIIGNKEIKDLKFLSVAIYSVINTTNYEYLPTGNREKKDNNYVGTLFNMAYPEINFAGKYYIYIKGDVVFSLSMVFDNNSEKLCVMYTMESFNKVQSYNDNRVLYNTYKANHTYATIKKFKTKVSSNQHNGVVWIFNLEDFSPNDLKTRLGKMYKTFNKNLD